MIPRELQGPIALQAYRISAVMVGIAFLLLLPGWSGLSGLVLLAAVANLAFFRNPGRIMPAGEHRIVSPADGKVVEVCKLDDPDGFVGPALRVAIFLSVLDVHINRVPFSGRVRAIRTTGSRFLAAFNPDASERNVQTLLKWASQP